MEEDTSDRSAEDDDCQSRARRVPKESQCVIETPPKQNQPTAERQLKSEKQARSKLREWTHKVTTAPSRQDFEVQLGQHAYLNLTKPVRRRTPALGLYRRRLRQVIRHACANYVRGT